MNKEWSNKMLKTLREKVLEHASEMEGWVLKNEDKTYHYRDYEKNLSLSENKSLHFHVNNRSDSHQFIVRMGYLNYNFTPGNQQRYLDLNKILGLDAEIEAVILYNKVNDYFTNKQIETAREKDLTLLANALGIKID